MTQVDSHSGQMHEFRLPAPGTAVLSLIGYSLGVGLLVIVLRNLMQIRQIPILTVLASLCWLMLVLFVIGSNLWFEGGVRQYFINRLGAFSKTHFVRIEPGSKNENSLQVGYSLFGQDFYYLQVAIGLIESIDWRTGQATALSGSDQNDWHVVLWYHSPAVKLSEPIPGYRDDGLYLIGHAGPKESITELGMAFVRFLQESGVELVPGKDDCEYVTPARRAVLLQDDESA
ncbi:hypothetical protein Pan241w_28540 [Gimesia alba]|uniref:Uncharacterized protein n=1 Tax=Gimesia alba TaxID=2527973 RepID=A0A517RFZ7_9PLAN|nr:hypothetical protein [Gimesia alba]QDT42765.1 hypothetical protein Pan241w_28540 [Gimesia alba]